MQPVHICFVTSIDVSKKLRKSCFTRDMLQSVIVSGAVIYHISNVNGVSQYTRITALYNTSVIFLAVQKSNKIIIYSAKYACRRF